MRRPLMALLLLGCPAPEPIVETEQDVPIAIAGEDAVVQEGVEIILDGRESTNGEASWDMGDGTVIAGLVARHTYKTAGNYVAVLSVAGAGGLRRTDSVAVTVHVPRASPAPVSSTGMGVDNAGRVWLAVPESGQVVRVDPETQSARYLEACDQPRQVHVAGSEAAVSCEGSGELIIFDTESLERTRSFSLGEASAPFGVAGRDGDWWVSTQAEGEVFSVQGGSVSWSSHGPGLRGLAVDSAGNAWASRWRSPHFGGELYGPGEPIRLEIDPGPDTDTGNRGVPNLLESMVLTPDGKRAFIGGLVSNNQRGLSRDGNPLTFESTLRATLRVVDMTTGEERLDERKQFDNHDRVSAMTLSPEGNWLWVAHPGTATVHRLDVFTLDISGAVLEAGIGVNALATSADGNILFAHAWLDRELRAFDVSQVGVPPTLLFAVPTVQTEPLNPTVLQGKKLFHDSRDPRMARHGYLNCAACHPDGKDDGMIWDFTDRGEGLRNTISLEGRAGTAMGPLHWTANFDEVQDFEACIRMAQGGSGLLSDADWGVPETADGLGDPKAGLSGDLDALAAYLTSLDTTPASPWLHTGNGEELFAREGCAACHDPGNLYTDSSVEDPKRHDIGTWSESSGNRLGEPFAAFDTPTLLGTWATAPYMHDGSASTIAIAIARHELEGVDLTTNEVLTLASWIESL